MIRKSFIQHKKFQIILMICALILTALACSVPGQDAGISDATPTYTFPVFASATPVEPLVTPDTSGTQATQTSPPPSSNATGVACLAGTWSVDPQAAQSYAMATMLGNNQLTFTPSNVSGQTVLTISGSQMNVVAQDLQADLVSNTSTVTLVVSGTASANFSATDQTMYLSGIVYSAQGTLIEPVQTHVLDLNGLLNFAQSLSFATNWPALPTQMTLPYSCGGNTLTVVINSHASVTLNRIG
jgi:hypothetical protein